MNIPILLFSLPKTQKIQTTYKPTIAVPEFRIGEQYTSERDELTKTVEK